MAATASFPLQQVRYPYGYTKNQDFYHDYGNITDPKLKVHTHWCSIFLGLLSLPAHFVGLQNLMFKERLKKMTEAEEAYFEDWGGKEFIHDVRAAREMAPIDLPIHEDDLKKASQESGGIPSAPPTYRSVPMSPRVHHDVVDWRVEKMEDPHDEDVGPIASPRFYPHHTSAPDILPPQPPARITFSAMRIGHPPAVRVKVQRDASVHELRAAIGSRLDLEDVHHLVMTDKKGSFIVRTDDIDMDELIYVEVAKPDRLRTDAMVRVDPFRRDARERQVPAPLNSGIRKELPTWYVEAPKEVKLTPFERRRARMGEYGQSVSHGKAAVLDRGFGADQRYNAGCKY